MRKKEEVPDLSKIYDYDLLREKVEKDVEQSLKEYVEWLMGVFRSAVEEEKGFDPDTILYGDAVEQLLPLAWEGNMLRAVLENALAVSTEKENFEKYKKHPDIFGECETIREAEKTFLAFMIPDDVVGENECRYDAAERYRLKLSYEKVEG